MRSERLRVNFYHFSQDEEMRATAVLCLVLCVLGHVQGSRHHKIAGESKLAKEIRSNMDFSVDPCDDFYRFACGSWINNTVLSADETIITKSFSLIEKQNRKTLTDLLEGDYLQYCL